LTVKLRHFNIDVLPSPVTKKEQLFPRSNQNQRNMTQQKLLLPSKILLRVAIVLQRKNYRRQFLKETTIPTKQSMTALVDEAAVTSHSTTLPKQEQNSSPSSSTGAEATRMVDNFGSGTLLSHERSSRDK
jgi:hypothetical protein